LSIKFPVNRPLITEADINEVSQTLQEGWVSGESPVVSKFENAFADYMGVQSAIAVSSGSTALDVAFTSLNLSPGDEVILPSFTIISCLAPILRLGLKPIFVDSSAEDWNLDVEKLTDLITEKTRAVLVVHTYGIGANVGKISDICKEKNLFLIEDCAEALGARVQGRLCGTFGDISIFSFYSNKLITTGEGGMCITSRPELAEKMRKIRNLGFESDLRFRHRLLGYNFRMSSMQASLGLSQLSRAESHLKIKKDIAKRYQANLNLGGNFSFQISSTDFSENTYWVAAILNLNQSITGTEMVSKLEQAGVGARPFFYPLHRQPLLKDYGVNYAVDAMPVANKLWEYGFYIPSGNGYTINEIDQISESVQEIINDYI
jgi:perosamine synthetase